MPEAKAAIYTSGVQSHLTYQQTGPNTVIAANSGDNAQLFAYVNFVAGDNFDGGTMTFPGASSPVNLSKTPYSQLTYVSEPMTRSALDTAFPSGSYDLTATSSIAHTSQSVSGAYLSDLSPDNIPQLTSASFNALSHAATNAAETFAFNGYNPDPRAAGSDLNFIVGGARGYDASYYYPSNGTVTSITLPGKFFNRTGAYTWTVEFTEFTYTPDYLFLTDHSVDTTGMFVVSGPGGVPEPANWTLMLFGFGGLGAAIRFGRGNAGGAASAFTTGSIIRVDGGQ